ncbi:MAG: serine/threonine protein kinase, partial [Akkermansia sp.]|nr:serine/threonine protein kinase [Akkermansia sp.]
MSSRPQNALPDRQILNNSYRIKRCLTAGGFGITYIVEDSRGVEYVVKEHFPAIYAERDVRSGRVVPKADQLEGYNWSLNAFRTEAEQLSVLNHPNIVSLIDAFDENDTAYYVMPYITGGDLTYITKSLIANGDHLTQAAVLKLLRSLLGALQHMHSRRLRTTGEVIYHFDIKPANVLLGFTPDGRDVVPTFIDFGSPSMGTPGYMPHEQRDNTNLGPWSDIYALGATMHRLLTGVAPPSHLDDENNPLPSAPPRDYLSANEALLQCYDSDLLESIDRSLEWEPYNRFTSAEEWLAVLSDIPLRFPDTGSKLIDYARTSEPVREEDDGSRVSPLVIAACALLLAGVLGAYVYFFVSGDESDSDYPYSGGESTSGNEVANDYTPEPVNDPLHSHTCPGANSTDRTATEQGAELRCSTCQSRLSEMKDHEYRCPGANSTDRSATEQGAALGCSTCQSRLSEMKEHENHCPGANSTNRTATEQGAALGCSTCKSRLAQISDHSCPGAASADRSAVESGAALGCATCQSRLSEMKDHEYR